MSQLINARDSEKRKCFENRCARLCTDQAKLRNNLCERINHAVPIIGYMRVDSIVADYIYVDTHIINYISQFAYANGPIFPDIPIHIGKRFWVFTSYDICVSTPYELNAGIDINSIDDVIFALNGVNIKMGLFIDEQQPHTYYTHRYAEHDRDLIIKYINRCIPP